MEEKFYLVKYADNWGDEMDIEGHVVLNQEDYNNFQRALEELVCFTFYIGTNEEIDYEDDMEELARAFTVTEITRAQFDVLRELGLAEGGFGLSFVDQVMEAENYYN